jgi:hypothetical protein
MNAYPGQLHRILTRLIDHLPELTPRGVIIKQLLIPLRDMLVHDGEIRIHLAKRLEDGGAVRRIELARDAVLELLNGTFVRVRGHRPVRGLVRRTVEDVDRICETALRRSHGTHGVPVCFRILL